MLEQFLQSIDLSGDAFNHKGGQPHHGQPGARGSCHLSWRQQREPYMQLFVEQTEAVEMLAARS